MPIHKRFILIGIVVLVLLSCITIPQVFSQSVDTSQSNLDTINQQLAQLNDELNKSVAATKPLESQLTNMQKQIAGIKNQVAAVESASVTKEKDINNGYKHLEEKEKVISQTIRDFYVKSYYDSPMLIFLSNDSASEVTQALAYQRARTEQDKAIIMNIALTIVDLEEKKRQLEEEKKWLIATRASLDEQSAKLDKVVKEAQAHQASVSMKISELSAKQQEIIQAKGSGFTTTIGDSDLADDYNASIKGFRESAPNGYFAIFSFGAYTHRNGMSQYGAKARAEAGQSVEDILKAYYPNATLKKDYAVPGSITVDGVGSIPFEDQYLQGIYEMPGTWHVNALKAQAIAARTYAVRYTNNGEKAICTTESCQVFKNTPKGGTWQTAVNETKGWVLVDGSGSPVSTQYASTHGGFSNTGGWDTTDGSGGSGFAEKAYEKMAASPWFYKAWYRKGYTNTGDTCGRSAAWLSPQEMADIVNAHLVMTKGDSGEKGRITPVSCWGGNPYSMDELRDLASKYGGIGSATSVTVTQGNGTTNNVTINGVSMSGSDFRNAVYLRAPGYIRIPQGSPTDGWAFFNIEKK